jgi:hypothetical protein
MNLEQAVTIAGGRADAQSLPAVIPLQQYKSVQASLEYASDLFSVQYRANAGPGAGNLHIIVTQSSAFDCRSRQLDNQDAVIFMPLGFLIRTRIMARMLLRYWGKERRILTIGPADDPVPESTWRLPTALEPLFDDLHAQDWDRLATLDEAIDLPPLFELDVQELMHLSVIHLLLTSCPTSDVGIPNSENSSVSVMLVFPRKFSR